MNSFFDIFKPEWWMNENNNALQMADAILFLILAIPVVYLFIFALFSQLKYKNPYPKAAIPHRFLVLFTVLRNGKEVIESINHFIDHQDYPRDRYDIAVAATQLAEEDLNTLLSMPVNIVIPDKEKCSKVYAIQQVMERYSPDEYDMVLVLNCDNQIANDALTKFNNAYWSGCDSIQAHRMTANLNSTISVLSATSEEINNSIFRKAHTKLGFSSALIGSAMAFDFRMFHEIAPSLQGSDLSKAMEMELLQQNVYTEYLEEVICYGRKAEETGGYEEQRMGWVNAQWGSTFFAMKELPMAFIKGEWDYCNKLFQWMLPSRLLLIALIILCAVGVTLLDWTLSFKWYALIFALVLAFLLAMPSGKIAAKFWKNIWALPLLIFSSVFSPVKKVVTNK
ncbi:MAG: glycosyltransferase [Bacteroides sp.]|nr:glycosyltransferase [Bacteroides sp.]